MVSGFENTKGVAAQGGDPYSLRDRQEVDAYASYLSIPAPQLLGLDWERQRAYAELARFVDRSKEVCQVLPQQEAEMVELARFVLSLRSALYIGKTMLSPFNAVRPEHYAFLLKQKKVIDAYRLEVRMAPIVQGSQRQIVYAERLRACAYDCMRVMRLVMCWRVDSEKRDRFNQVVNEVCTRLFGVQAADYWIKRSTATWLYTPSDFYKVLFGTF